ncbi:MAG: neutral zinc metallopeptidase [Sphingomonadales bacterium]|nr:neutral zinc metallopeptidase [Sphingomonadales bacterium]MBD3774519.1 neutral zinc metallopeptidase [Paracoccaceae bacterium]
MKLNRFDTSRIKVGQGGGGGGLPGGGGTIGCGGLVIVIIAALVFGVDPGEMLGQMGAGDTTSTSTQQQQGQMTEEQLCTMNPYATEACNTLTSLNDTWEPLFKKANIPFEQPTLWFYQGGTRSGCGNASASMGPFYCPADMGIYIDTSFYDVMARQLGAKGDFARYYVVAHEYGHHVQKMTGMADQVRSAQQQNPRMANQLQVRMELQADCYAGVWAGKNRNLIEPGDMEEGLNAASAIGDDTLQRNSGQSVNPESFTHGSSAERVRWLRIGMETADEDKCDTFADLRS